MTMHSTVTPPTATVVPAAGAPATPKANPSKVRLALIMLVAIYPLITVLLYVVLPLTEGWTIWERTLVIAPIMVVSIVFFIAPQVQKRFGWFIARLPRPTR